MGKIPSIIGEATVDLVILDVDKWQWVRMNGVTRTESNRLDLGTGVLDGDFAAVGQDLRELDEQLGQKGLMRAIPYYLKGTPAWTIVPIPVILKAGRDTDQDKLAAAIASEIRNQGVCLIRTIGASPLNNTVKAIIIAQSYLIPKGILLFFFPRFIELKAEDGADLREDQDAITALETRVVGTLFDFPHFKIDLSGEEPPSEV